MRNNFKKYIFFFAVAILAFACTVAEELELFEPTFNQDVWMKSVSYAKEIENLKNSYIVCSTNALEPAIGFHAPIDLYPDGRKKNHISAQKAQMFFDINMIWAEGVRIEQYKKDGSIEGWLEAENCIIDRKSKLGWVPGKAIAEFGENKISGTGIFFSTTNQFIKITEKAHIISKSIGIDWNKVL